IVVEDQVARVAIDQTFHNPAAQVMEGQYKFAIPPDASLQRLAMYVNGVLTESAVVERMQARRIYEDVVYRRLDPALLEWAGTGRLNLKVYPLPAQQDKRLLLAYTQSMPKLYDDWTLTVPLPEVDLPVGELAFDVRVKGCANCEVTSTSHKIAVKRTGDDAVVSYKEPNARIGDSLVLHVRDKRKQTVTAFHTVKSAEGRTRSSAEGDAKSTDGADTFVMVRARPELAQTARAYRPRTWVILDDVSASRDVMARRAQHDLIDGFLRELDEDDRIAIFAFDVAARQKLAPTRVLDVDRKTVRAALASEGGVGATDVAAAIDAAVKLLEQQHVAADDAMIVYLGDGVITSGPRQLDEIRKRLAGKAHFVGVGVGDGPDTQTLEALAAATAGYSTTIDLADDVGWRAFDLVAALHTSRVTKLEARLVDASGAAVPATVYVKSPQLADGEELELVAKLAGGNDPVAVELTGTLNGAPWQQRVALDHAERSGGYIPRLWAQRHIQARLLAKHEPVTVPPCVAAVQQPAQPRGRLAPPPVVCKTEAEAREERDEAIRKDIVALGKKYFLLSRHTSLLVLEDDAMYKKYDVQKGAGETWAPYVVPAKIEVVTKPTVVVSDIAGDAELVRRPLQVFYSAGYYDPSLQLTLDGSSGDFWNRRGEMVRLRAAHGDGFVGTRATLGLAQGGPEAKPQAAFHSELESDRKVASVDKADDVSGEREQPLRDVVFADEVTGGVVTGTGGGRFLNKDASDEDGRFMPTAEKAKSSGWRRPANIGYPVRLGAPTDQTYDDLTAFVPALLPDASESWRRELKVSAGGARTHAIDDSARALLEAARRALPAGLYRWGDLEIGVDAAHHFGWRRTTGADLAETASFDGATWTRRYSELGLDVTRTFAEDDIALGLAYLPVWIADPAHYTRWFDVRSKSAREVTLARSLAKGKTEIAYTLEFDDKHRLVAIRDSKNTELVTVTWGAVGPSKARVFGGDVEIGFTGLPIPDAGIWAHASTTPGVVVEMPMHLPAYWGAKLAKLTVGSAEWRHAQRQRMASMAAVNQRTELFNAYDALRTHGGVELGDLALASSGIETATTDAQFAAALAPASVKASVIAGYLQASRAYGQSAKTDRIKATSTAGFVGALWTLREVTALLAADKNTQAVDRLIALGTRAFDLRLVAAGATANRYTMKPADVVRVWDSVAVGEYKNVARAQAATVLASRSQFDAAADRVATLVAELDLEAIPPNLGSMQYQFQQSRRGAAGWQLVWATWRDRALAGTSYEHVLALLPLASGHPIDVPVILARAAVLAGGNADRTLTVARMAISLGHAAFGNSLIEPLVKAHPTRELHQLVAQNMLSQNKLADALEHLEAAQTLAVDEAVSLQVVRNELAQLITVARQLAVQSQGAARKAAVQRAMEWGTKWRAIDPGNAQIDSLLGELQLAVGDKTEAFRQLSSVIERDPMSGDGYQTVAQAFESQGRVAEALEYWHQATIIDQTNPTPRLREAQAMIALGRAAEGDKLLAEIANRKWHVRWDSVVYQVKAMIERAKQPDGRGWGGDE
ncbi:MAG: VIT domain-containing protein, partial [Kofleriaceae bacterium]